MILVQKDSYLWMLTSLLMLLAIPAVAWVEEQPTLRFADQDRIGSIIPILAAKKGFFVEEGLHVEPLRFNNGPACAEALYTGAADMGSMGDTAAIILAVRNPKFVIIGSLATGEHRHRIMVRKDATLQTIQDLRGKRLGVKKGTSTHGGLLAAIAKAGLSPTDLDIIDLSPSTAIDALLAGSLDAFAASEPTPTTAEQKGARQLATLGGLGNEYPVLLVADSTFLHRKPGTVNRLMRALEKASQYVAGHQEETASLLATETGLSIEATRGAMLRHDYHLRLDESILSSLKQTALFLKQQNLVNETPDWAVTLNHNFMPLKIN